MIDPRVEETRKIVESIVAKSMFHNTNILINNNKVIMTVDDTGLYIVDLKNISSNPLPPIAFRYSDIISFENKDECISDRILVDKLYNLYNTYFIFFNSRPIVASNSSLRDDENFEKLLSMKSSDGMKFYKMLGTNNTIYHVPIFSGFPNLNKQDNIGITIYDLLDGYLAIDMTIFKKKINRNIDMIFRSINLDSNSAMHK